MPNASRTGKRREFFAAAPELSVALALRLAGLASVVVGVAPALAEVVEADDNGFVSAFEIEVAASPERVFDALTAEVSKWWDPRHTYSGDSSNMLFDNLALREKLAGGGFVRHMVIDMERPPQTLRLRGGMGPLQTLAVVGSMTFDLEAAADGTLLRYRYVVNGRGLGDWAEPVDRVMGGQLQRLRLFVETGQPIETGRAERAERQGRAEQ